jgi:EmrB/QacA subfamily drug resistance transporter
MGEIDAVRGARSRTTRRQTAGLVLVCAAQLMLVLDLTVVNVALPSMSADIGLSGVQTTGVITAYVVTFGGLMLAGGRFADVYGRRRVLTLGIVVFTASSLVCGLAASPEVLLAGRVAQGQGAALMSPAALATVTGLFHGPARVRALATWAGIGAFGFVAGLVVGGLLTSGPGWRWIFLVNVPIGLLLIAGVRAVLAPDESRERSPSSLDLVGAALWTGTVGSLVLGLSLIGEASTPGEATLAALAAAGVLAVAFVVVESRTADPILAPNVLRQGPVALGFLVMLVASAGMLTLFFVASMYTQRVLGLDAWEAGLVFVPSAIAAMVAAHLGGHVITHHGTRVVAVAGFALVAVGAGLLSRLDADSSVATAVVPGLVLTSLGLGPAIVVATSTTLARVSDRDAGVASGIVNTGHELGGAIGLGLIAAVLGDAVLGTQAGAYADAFLGIALGALLMAVMATRLIPPMRPDPEYLVHGH